MSAPTKEELIERLLAAHAAWFDVTRRYEFSGHTFPGYAEFHSHGEQYVLVKRAKLWEVDAHEYLFFDAIDHLDMAALDEAVRFMTTSAIEKVEPKPNHMSSYLSLVLVTDSADKDAMDAVRKVRFRKNFMLGIRGWADLRLAVVDLATQRIATNGAGKELHDTLKANLSACA